MADVLRDTRSVCPVCLRPVDAELVREGGAVFLEKACPDHGAFRVPVWQGKVDFAAWTAGALPLGAQGLRCPTDCGICPEHEQDTCCALLEVTPRCNLRCRFCFADGGVGTDPAFSDICAAMDDIARLTGKPLLQLSGGEPTVREDLPDIIAAAKEKGFPYVQLNTNGLRLAREAGYCEKLKAAGLSIVFLQFDGVDDRVYRYLRGGPLLDVKQRAIAACAEAGLGVTLVPTVVPGINTHMLGEIIRYGAGLAPAVRGVHFQPVSYFGRIPKNPAPQDRYTLDALLSDIAAQTSLEVDHFVPSRCDHPLCGFHGTFLASRGELTPLHHGPAPTRKSTARQNREYVARHWIREQPGSAQVHYVDEACDLHDMETFVRRIRTQSFTITAMAFQDAWNLNIERLHRCSLHVYDNGQMKPFCAKYLTGVAL